METHDKPCIEWDEYESQLCGRIIDSIERNGGKDILRSIILTGSLGRGEATYEVDLAGQIQLKSDVELALVYRIDRKKTDQLINRVSAEFEEELNLMPINECRIKYGHNFNYSLITPRKKSIFTFDLYNGSKTIWGTDYLNGSQVDVSEVDLYEAKRLVANRVGELIWRSNEANQAELIQVNRQWRAKLVLAIGGAWLLLMKKHVSSYRSQYQQVLSFAENIDEDVGNGFADEYGRAFRFLRDSGPVYEISDQMLRDYVRSISSLFTDNGLDRPMVNCFARKVKCLIKYIGTDREYGWFGYENRINDALLTGFYKNAQDLQETARIWHNVLY